MSFAYSLMPKTSRRFSLRRTPRRPPRFLPAYTAASAVPGDERADANGERAADRQIAGISAWPCTGLCDSCCLDMVW